MALRGTGLMFLAALALAAALAAGPARACDASVRCPVDNGYYLVKTPPGWDGKSPLPVVVFFHGYGAEASEVVGDEPLAKAVNDLGAMLVAPGARNKNWSFPGKLMSERDDFKFVAAVLDDVEKRFPVDPQRIMATGFSVGGSMTWYLACHLGERFSAFAPIAGAFWEPLPVSCPSGPVALRHIHGTADRTVPMAGRALRGGLYKQGDVMESFSRLKKRDGCTDEPVAEEARDPMTCKTWSAKSCASGREVVLCLHPGEHEIEANWVADGFRWMDGLAKKGEAAKAAVAKFAGAAK